MNDQLLPIILSTAFGLWAGVVAWIGKTISTQIKEAAMDLKALDRDLRGFINATERRLTRLETEQESTTEKLEKTGRRLDDIFRQYNI